MIISLNEIKAQLELKSSCADNTFYPFYFFKTFLDEPKDIQLDSSPLKLIGSKTECFELLINDTVFNLATTGLHPDVSIKLPISNFECEIFDNKIVDNFEKAIRLLLFIDEECFNTVSDFIKLFFLTKNSDTNQITSATYPIFPFCSFFSERAFYHLPPFFLNDHPSNYILCENIYHESIHQKVNLLLLLKDILNNDYSYLTSNKIKIPWRNSRWQIDRVIHAAFVYKNLIEFRKIAAFKLPKNEFLLPLIIESKSCYKYLRNKIFENTQMFTIEGLTILHKELPPTEVIL